MKCTVVGLFIFFFSALSFSLSAQHPVISRGPFMVYFDANAIYGKDSRLFVTSTAGVFYTDDRETWKNCFPNSSYEADVTKDKDGNVYYYQNGAVYKTPDNGTTWDSKFFYLIDDENGSVSFPYQNTRVRVQSDTIFISTSDGVGYMLDGNYSGVNFHEMSGKQVQEMEVDGNHIVALDPTGLLHYSLDRGATWTSKTFPYQVYGDAKMAVSGSKIWVFTQAIYYSDDMGDTWEVKQDGFNGYVSDFEWADGKLYASAAKLFVFSEEDGDWDPVKDIGQYAITVAMDGDHIFLASLEEGMSSGMFKETTDGGDTWDDIPLTGYTSSEITAMDIDSDSTIYASTTEAIYKKVKGGSTFERFIGEATGAMLLDGDDLYVGNATSLDKYNKNTGELISSVEVDTYAMLEMVKDGTDLFINIAYNKVVRVSSGGTVTPFNTGLEGRFFSLLTSGGGRLYVGTDLGVYSTPTDVADWQKIDTGSDLGNIFSIYANGDKVIVSSHEKQGTEDTSVITHDGGETWDPVEIEYFMHDIKYSDGKFYGAGYDRAYISYDDGLNWLSRPLEKPQLLYSSEVLPTKDSIYVGTTGAGIWSFKKLKMQQIDFGPIEDKTIGDAPFDVNATTTEDLPVTYSTYEYDPAKISIDGNTITMVSAGRVYLIASQSGTSKIDEASPKSQSFCIKPVRPVITTSNASETSVTLTSSADYNLWYLDDELIPDVDPTEKEFIVTEDGEYTVKTRVEDCNSDASVAVTFPIPEEPEVTGLEEAFDASIQIFPNPAKDQITVAAPEASGIQLTDMLGVTIERRTANETGMETFHVQSLAKGLYMFRVNLNGKVVVRKFLKQ